MKIGELAARAQCQVETIRFYEQAGLLPSPARNASNYRVYSDVHLQRLQFILRCRKLDMAHDEIRGLLKLKDDPAAPCGEVTTLLEAHIGHVVQRIKELQALEKTLTSLNAQCLSMSTAEDCGILNGLSASQNPTQAIKRNPKPQHTPCPTLQTLHNKKPATT